MYVCIYVYMYTCICTYTQLYAWIHIYYMHMEFLFNTGQSQTYFCCLGPVIKIPLAISTSKINSELLNLKYPQL